MKHYQNSSEKRFLLFWLFVGVAAISAMTYAYSLVATVHVTAERQRLTQELSDLSGKVGDLEFKTIAIRNQIDLNKALAAGYVEVKNPIFVSRTEETLSINLGKK